MIESIDQLNSTIRLASTPRRIVSLVPSQTQLLHAFGFENEVVGITKFCISPDEWFQTKTRVGGTKSVHIEKVRALQPDLIIGNKEENTKEDIEALRAIAPVWMSDIYTLNDALHMIESLGTLLGKENEASSIKHQIQQAFQQLSDFTKSHETFRKSVLYFIWNQPDFVAGKNTFIDSLLTACGLVNACEDERYPEANPSHQPDFIFLSSEPFPFEQKHLQKFQRTYPHSKIVLVDGEMFSWYGSKLMEAPKYFQALLKSIGLERVSQP